MIANRAQRGFTLVELTLAMAFMSILLLAIIFITLQAGKLYAKGETYKTVNQASRELVDGIRRDFSAATSDKILTPNQLGTSGKYAGRVCTGAVSYVWNTANLINDSTVAISQKITDIDNKTVVFRRVIDNGAYLCTPDMSGKLPMTIRADMESTELLGADGRALAVYDAAVKLVQQDPSGNGKALYSLHMTMGTNDPDTTTLDPASGYQCRPPTDNTANFDYCSVVEFDTIVRAGGGL